MSQELLPVIEYLAERGQATCVRAIVKGNPLKTDVILHTARAGELGADWFSQVEQAANGPVIEPLQAVVPPEPIVGVTESPAPPPPPSLPPANWYPDPHGVKRLRFWDGAQWTDHTAD